MLHIEKQLMCAVQHTVTMGILGYGAGVILKTNPKLFACAGVVSSVCFQVLSEIVEYALQADGETGVDESIDEINKNRLYGRISALVITAFPMALLAGINETSGTAALVKASLMLYATLTVSFSAAYMGNYTYFGEIVHGKACLKRDISLLCVDRDPLPW